MPPLTIGIDARELLGDATGVGRYLGELLRRWVSRPDSDRRQFVLFTPDSLPLPLPAERAVVRRVGRGRGTWWEQTSLRRAVAAETLDVFFAPAYTAPLGLRCPLAVTIHDISFLAHPEWFRTIEGMRRRWLTRHAARTASVVFTDSRFSREEIQIHLGVESSRLVVVPPGVTARVTDPPPPAARDPLVLFVGSLFNRRRLPHLIQAFARATRDLPEAALAIVGDDRTWPPQDLSGMAVEHGVAGRTRFLSYVTEDALADLYRRARVFVFLSEYEGFGLTPLEALAAGVPPVVLDTPVAREVYGDAAEFVPPDDIRTTADAIHRLLTDTAAAGSVLARAPAVLARYSWQRAADETLAGIERIAAR